MRIPDDINFADYLKFVGQQESQDLHWSAGWRESAKERMSGNTVALGACLPWNKTHPHVRLRPGEVSVWAGINGHKKSMLTGQVALWLARQQKVCMASLEMKPEATLERMIKQAAGTGNPPDKFIDKWFDWADSQILIYDKIDTTPAESILGMCYYAGREMGIEHMFIDSLMKCQIDTDDHTGQKGFLDRLALCAKDTGMHIHLIAHMRKGKDEYAQPGKFDVAGSGDITNMIDNLFVCWKNKQKEAAQFKLKHGGKLTTAEEKLLDYPDQDLIIEKQRHGEFEGKFHLWFDNPSLQFLESESSRVMRFEIPEVAA